MNKTQKERAAKLVEMGCLVCGAMPVELHHLFTGAGGRKNHDYLAPLCFNHHRGSEGIHFLGRKKWQSIYGTEQELLDKLESMM
jgi:hypothetical protein